MNYNNFILVLTNFFILICGVIYMIYSVLFRNKVTLYNFNDRMKIIDRERFLKLQLRFAIINSMLLVVSGLIIAIYNLDMVYGLISIMVFHIINWIFKIVAKGKGYIL